MITNVPQVDCITRLLIELNNKLYYGSNEYELFLAENGLNPILTYNKVTMQKQLLQTVYDILESLANNIDLFRRVETEFANTGEAYKYLQQRLNDIQKRILAIPDVGDNAKTSFGFMFHG